MREFAALTVPDSPVVALTHVVAPRKQKPGSDGNRKYGLPTTKFPSLSTVIPPRPTFTSASPVNRLIRMPSAVYSHTAPAFVAGAGPGCTYDNYANNLGQGVGATGRLDPEAIEGWKQRNGKAADATVADLATDPDLTAEVDAAVKQANLVVSHAESIRKFTILPVDFTEDTGELTPTMKVKRNVVAEKFADAIEAIYAKGAKD